MLWIVIMNDTFTQPFHFEVFDTRDGLLSNDVRCLHQDTKGYLWIGTAMGLSRYDGYEFKNFTRSDGLPKGKIMAIEETANGQIWIMSQTGLVFYQEEKFHSVLWAAEKKETEILQALHESPDGKLWLGTNRRLSYLSLKHRAAAMEHRDSSFFYHFLGTPFVRSVASDSLHRVFVNNYSYLLQYENGQLDTIGQRDKGVDNFFYKILPIDSQRIWVGTKDGAVLEFKNGEKKTIFSPPKNRTQIINIIPHKNQYWLLNENGINILKKDGTYSSYSIYEKLSINLMWCMIKDKEDNFWAGSNEGLIRITNRDFDLYPNLQTVMPNGVFSIGATHDNTLLFGSNHARVYTHKPEKGNNFYKKELPNGFSTAEIVSLFYDKQGHLWLPTYWDGIFKIEEKKLKKYWYDDGLAEGADINFGFCSQDSSIWVGHNLGLSRFILDAFGGYKIKNYLYEQQVYFYTYAESSLKQIWFGGDDGLYFFQKDSIFKYNLPEKDISVGGLTVDAAGNLWVATQGNGLYQFKERENYQLELLNHFHTNNGLSTNFLLDAEADDLGNIWLGTYQGFSVVKQQQIGYHIINYEAEDGLIDKAFHQIKLHKDTQGIIWAATSMGLMSFHPKQIHFNVVPPQLHLVDIKVHGKTMKMPADKKLNLKYNENSLVFEMLGISLKNPNKIQYTYWLEGGMEDWSIPSAERNIRFEALSPGNYVFHYKAANNDQVWNKQAQQLVFTIQPPFWQTFWFLATVIVIFLILTWLMIKRREQRIKSEEQERSRVNQMVAELETRALRAQMNPHFIFNCLNAIQECILTEEIDTAYSYLFKFSRLLRKVLESSSKSLISIDLEIEILTLYLELEAMRFDEKFSFSIEQLGDEEWDDMYLPSLMIQPFAENAIWHGLMHKTEDRQLFIQFSADEESLYCKIKDNGIGRTAAEQNKSQRKKDHESLALQMITDRLKIIAQQTKKVAQIQIEDVLAETGQVAGTLVLITVPNDLFPKEN